MECVVVPQRSVVDALIAACPFLILEPDILFQEGATIVFGTVASLMKRRQLSDLQIASVFDFFNRLAEIGIEEEINVLATGALELFNDDAASQCLARTHLKGAALTLLEDMRVLWGQPDYGPGRQL